ncbi:MAG: PQQ-dependent dehydrogenase, methanol/ethanol family [Hyphomonadaceae bacterium]|nr:PQQ-dependent dehydrogenase, methanol/ethanol family [Hyphomonadaceae bacterium]
MRWMRMAALALCLAAPLGLAACGRSGPAKVDAARLAGAESEPGQWMSYGRTYDEQRFSPLSRINSDTVSRLGLAWFADLDTARGQEATPIMVDGALYVSTAWSMVKAYDARTGRELWSFDPQVNRAWGVHACCDVVNRGVAVWNGRVYVGALDGRLIAIDARDGTKVWETQTVDTSKPYTITGAPRIVKGLVIIGNGGAELGVRGYVSAYDANDGTLKWRFYTTPNPNGPDNAASDSQRDRMLASWSPQGAWRETGGGGTVWDSMAYDPTLDLLYIGVGNGAPWNKQLRSPGDSDDLFLSSIVALKPETGEYVWHFQETPGETWDYTATQHIMVATLNISGQERRVIMHAPKNGYFYVLDAATGAFIQGKNYVPVNWATGLDPQTGRPNVVPAARFAQTGVPFVATPGPGGAHNWQPMSFNPATGLVYIPVNLTAFPYIPERTFTERRQAFNTGVDFAAGAMPRDPAVRAGAMANTQGALIAWNPATQTEAWRVARDGPGNGGTLTTAGGLVFQGTAAGEFAAYRADNGRKVWSMQAHTGIIAAPMTYDVGGTQYVAQLVGSGGTFALPPGEIGRKGGGLPNVSRLLVFALDGNATLPAPPPVAARTLNPPPSTARPQVVALGRQRYAQYCGVCHGDAAVTSGLLPDLRYSAALNDAALWNGIVREGQLASNGMASFADALPQTDTDAVHAYLIWQANEDKRAGAAAPQ